MLKMPTKTLFISAVMILFAGCTTKQLPPAVVWWYSLQIKS